MEMRNAQDPPGLTRIVEANPVADVEIRKKAAREREAGGCSKRSRLGAICWCEPNVSGSEDTAANVASGPRLDDGRSRLNGAGAEFGTSDIHKQPAIASRFLTSFLKIANHAEPGFGFVMGTVDAHAIHAIADEVAHQCIVRGGVCGHGDHDANFSSGWGGPSKASVLASRSSAPSPISTAGSAGEGREPSAPRRTFSTR